VQQELSGLALLAQDLIDKLSALSAPEAERARRIASGIEEANRDLRSLARGLVPAEVKAGGLIAALDALAARVREEQAVECYFEHENGSMAMSGRVSTQLYRIAQEAVSNAIKHARAGEIRIYLVADRDTLVLTVIDNGIGIDEKSIPATGMGLKIMSYRASLIGAVLRIRKREEGGTVVSCTLVGARRGAEPKRGMATGGRKRSMAG
jgi:two-component system sensor kinase FixL